MEIMQMKVMVPCTEVPEEHHRSRAKVPMEHSILVRWCHSSDERHSISWWWSIGGVDLSRGRVPKNLGEPVHGGKPGLHCPD
jgi:hypothetical protein